MKTFKQLSEELDDLTNRKAILSHLVDVMEQNFKSNGSDAKNTLLRPDKLPVPEEAFELVVSEMLAEITAIDTEVETINKTALAPTDAAPKTTNKEKN